MTPCFWLNITSFKLNSQCAGFKSMHDANSHVVNERDFVLIP